MNKRPQIFDRSLERAIPIVFVLLWSTGWIVARLAADGADPLTFLLFRFAGAAMCLVVYAAVAGASWPRAGMDWVHALASGVLLHGLYLGGVWWAIGHGLPASISALLAALQPILTAFLAPRLAAESITARQWTGIFLGFGGLLLVLEPNLLKVDSSHLWTALLPLFVNALGMLSLTLGTFYQKRFIRTGDLRTVSVLQFVSAFLVTLPLAFFLEDMRITWTHQTIAALVWSILAVSVVSIALLLHLLRRGEVARSAQLIYLVPPTAALQVFLLFGERLEPIQLAGMIVTTAGVALAVKR
ncbi:MAG: putative amino-acid metabolite efflux pump [Hyphomicrobiales bacterium]|jgi:drug/metabolite transporter (DMT)-like permease|nr:putative amino-acid metabolite efflux pump [Hyphomicrobiales bacterium]